MSEATVEYEQLDQIVRIWMNRPKLRNAQSRGLLDDLDAAFRRAIADPGVRVIILGGRGDHFSAGHDLREARAERDNLNVEERYAYEELRYVEYALRIWDAPKPTIAAVQGACIAGAFMLANMCDLVVASEDAFFADTVCHQLGAAAVEVLVHPWVMGARRAKEMLYTGERFTAQDALQFGMVNRVVPRDQLDEKALELARKIAKTPPFGLKLTKRSINRTLDIQGFRNAVSAHFETHLLSHESQEFADVRQKALDSIIGPK